ncbi:uncharacterized protein LOC112204027 [Rosa chinensis]|uniref:uncharacterized protein LOC112204027 n=1 Tax=Rosa chinensis TaxID=74649 RepID=UPI000D08F729|nr:uncharacterized protein LOC112204027 [Rosa chinensis]
MFNQACYSQAALSLDIVSWLRFCMDNLANSRLEELFYLLWGVWKERNNRIWESKRSQAGDVIINSMARLSEYRFHNTKAGRSHSVRAQKWECPPIGFLKINFDGSFNLSTRKGGIGFVVCDSEGRMLARGGRSVANLISPEHAEVLACKLALNYIEENSCFPAIVETDALMVQRQLTTAVEPNAFVLGRLYDDLVEFLEGRALKVVHVKRSANNVAHLIANHAASSSQELLFFSAPPFLSAAVAAELSIV